MFERAKTERLIPFPICLEASAFAGVAAYLDPNNFVAIIALTIAGLAAYGTARGKGWIA